MLPHVSALQLGRQEEVRMPGVDPLGRTAITSTESWDGHQNTKLQMKEQYKNILKQYLDHMIKDLDPKNHIILKHPQTVYEHPLSGDNLENLAGNHKILRTQDRLAVLPFTSAFPNAKALWQTWQCTMQESTQRLSCCVASDIVWYSTVVLLMSLSWQNWCLCYALPNLLASLPVPALACLSFSDLTR